MPIDKQPKPATKKPITPALSSRFRNARAPLAPRLAGSTASSPVVTARKDVKAGVVAEETQSATALHGNVTPRSGARSSRIGTESPGTPGDLRRPSTTGSVQQSAAVSSPAANLGGLRLAATGPPGGLVRRISGSSALSRRDADDSKFFYAGDVKPALASIAQAQSGLKPSFPGSVRNIDGMLDHQSINITSTQESNKDDRDGMFIRANDIPLGQATPNFRPAAVQQISSSSASSLRARSPDVSRPTSTLSPQTSPRKTANTGFSRPGSPIKNFISSPHMVPLPDSPSGRRKSIGTDSVLSGRGAKIGHKKSASVSTIAKRDDVVPVPPTRSLMPDFTWSSSTSIQPQHGFPVSTVSPSTLSPRSTSLNSSRTAGTNATSDTDVSDIFKIMLAAAREPASETGLEMQQPNVVAMPPPQTQAQIDAANARRERKVLDLEISNSSLLAINKTLERELRKQSAEIRRFRRLSRTGRLSFAPTNRSISAQSMLSALSEQGDEDGLGLDSSEDEGDDSELSNQDDDNLSDTDSITARSRRRAREERRLLLDLSKHQQLLIDSQKLSQSIRKCVDLTEELIKDGKRALEYKVGIGDVQLGGRVLNNDEMNTEVEGSEYRQETNEARRGLLSPIVTMTELQEAQMWLSQMQLADQDADQTKTQSVHSIAIPVAELDSGRSTAYLEPG